MAPPSRASGRGDRHAAQREARRLALSALFESEFGQHTARDILERHLADEGIGGETAELSRRIVEAVVVHREDLDGRIERIAPQYPVVQLARIDRALLRSAIGELLHCPTTPARVAIAEWVEMARSYSGEAARRLVNGVLGRVASEATDRGREMPASGNSSEGGGDRHTGGSTGDSIDL